MVTKKITRNMITLAALISWVIYSYAFFSLRDSAANVAGYLVLVGEAGLDLLAAMFAYQLWDNAKNPQHKHIFLLFTFAFAIAVMVDSTYNVLLNLAQHTYEQPIAISLFEIPFLGFLFLQMLAWIHIVRLNRESGHHFSAYIPYWIIGAILLIGFMYLIEWEVEYFSVLGAYQTADTILEVIAFTLASICLARARNSFVRFIATGFMLIVASDFIIRYHVINGITPYLNHFEMSWILGLVFSCLGFSIYRESNNEKTFKLAPVSSMQSQITAWLIVVLLVAMLVKFV